MNSIDNNNQASFALRTLVGLAAAGLVLYFMHLMSDLVNNLFLAYIVVIIASPLLLWLRKKGAPDWLAFLLTLLAIAAGALALLAFVLNAAGELAAAMPGYIDDVEELQETVNELLANIGLVEGNLEVLLEFVEVRRVFQVIGSLVGDAFGLLSNAFVIILFVVFLLVQVFTTPRVMRHEIAAGNTYVQRALSYNVNLRRYILITTAIALVTGTLDTIWFIILGIPNPLIWGGIAALLSFVPGVGFWLAAIPPTLLALLEYGPLTAVITLIGILLINGFADNVVKPRYVGEGVDLAPFMVIFSVIFWTLILGPVGAVLGVPVTMLFKSLLLEPDGQLSSMARVMGSGKQSLENEQLVQETADAADSSDQSGET